MNGYYSSFVSGSSGIWEIKAGLCWETLPQTAVAVCMCEKCASHISHSPWPSGIAKVCSSHWQMDEVMKNMQGLLGKAIEQAVLPI